METVFRDLWSLILVSNPSSFVWRWVISQPLSLEHRAALAERGLSYDTVAAFDQALEEARHAVEHAPSAKTHYEYGLLLSSQYTWDEALKEFSSAITINPDHVSALAERGLAYGAKDHFEKGFVDLKVALQLEPENARVLTNRATLHVWRRAWKEVIRDASRSIAAAPDYPPPYRLRAIAYQASRNYRQAVADFKKYLELYPAAPDREKLRESIKHLEQSAARQGSGLLDKLLGRK